jgi:hypothetical protein
MTLFSGSMGGQVNPAPSQGGSVKAFCVSVPHLPGLFSATDARTSGPGKIRGIVRAALVLTHFGRGLHQVKFAEIASLPAQFAIASVSTTACEGSILEKVGTMSGCSAAQFGGVPYVGALFDSSNGQPTTHFATAFVVAGKYGNMLMSAAHILSGRSASSIIFAPGYANGQAPHNLWHVHKAYTDSAWQANQSIDDDFCFLKVGAGC